jgi:uncharacterized protein
MGNPVTWFEIHGPEPERTSTFYAELFGWHTETFEGGYITIDTHAGSGVNGGFGTTSDDQAPHTVFFAQGPDIDALLARATSLGGAVVSPVREIPDMVTYAMFTDPWGNLVGLIKGDEADTGRVSAGDNPPVDWFELACSEPEKAWDFYRELFGWTIRGSTGEGMKHGGVTQGSSGAARGGIGSSRDGKPRVDMYALVDDIAKYLERAESLGATTVMPPMKVDDHTTIAMFADPQGTAFGLYATD